RLRRAAGRGGRTGGAAVRAGAVQRHLRRHRQAHPQPADPRPAQGLSGAIKNPPARLRRRVLPAPRADQLTFMPSALRTGVHLSISDLTHFWSDSGVWRSSETISAPRSAILLVKAGDFSAVLSALLKTAMSWAGVPAGA